eukprot:TRINITY_DN9411_c0_g2_i1.p1 TRINITY_DN9411_c0_g2~~TRINITY_DN9411_c0_g2_i1.p1  ORF type:complete len:123 (-),score=19.15 TRINITY_DN9411_c0_g2_i1:91-459(-)
MLHPLLKQNPVYVPRPELVTMMTKVTKLIAQRLKEGMWGESFLQRLSDEATMLTMDDWDELLQQCPRQAPADREVAEQVFDNIRTGFIRSRLNDWMHEKGLHVKVRKTTAFRGSGTGLSIPK